MGRRVRAVRETVELATVITIRAVVLVSAMTSWWRRFVRYWANWGLVLAVGTREMRVQVMEQTAARERRRAG